MPTDRRISPIAGLGLEGYSDKLSVKLTDRVSLMVSGPTNQVNLDVVRLIHGDENQAGPGYKAESVDWGYPKTVKVEQQSIDYGSFIEIPHHDSLNPTSNFTIAMWFHPTLTPTGWHSLAAKWGIDHFSYGLFYAGDRFITAVLSHDGQTGEWLTARETAHVDCWHFVALTYDSTTGQASLYQRVGESSSQTETRSSTGELSKTTKTLQKGTVHPGKTPLYFGAIPDPTESSKHWAHFTGKIGHPVLFNTALSEEEIVKLSGQRELPASSDLLGCWDLSVGVDTSCVSDTSQNSNHGRVVNMADRAVTGPFWSGMPSRLYTDAPDDYNAIYFHEDDLEDARWKSSCEITVANDAKSGIYAAHLTTKSDEIFIPFVVSPKKPSAPIAHIIPTFTWQAYASNRSVYSYTEDGVLDSGLSLYNVHSDGSMLYYRTRLQPTRAWNPKVGFQNWGAHMITANLYLIDWLEEKQFSYDVYTDEDLHSGGEQLLSQYSCVILGSHPEYYTQQMMGAISGYTDNGGRILNLGGNSLYWVVSLDKERPHIMEVRRGGEGDYGPTYQPRPGEAQHSTTLELGGLWSRRRISPGQLLGVEFSANVWRDTEIPHGYHRTQESYDSRYDFIFEGIENDTLIGNFGLNLGSAVGFEMDSVHPDQQYSDSRPIVLAEAKHPDFTPPRRPPISPVSHIALWTRPRGGAVFSAGSVTWTGSLSHNGYHNNVSIITGNMLRRFLKVPRGQRVIE